MKIVISISLVILFIVYVILNAIIEYFKYKFKDLMDDEDEEDY